MAARSAALRDLPHVGGVAGRLDPDAVRRTIGEIRALLTARERQFAAAGIDSIARARGSRALDPHGDVFLVDRRLVHRADRLRRSGSR